MRYRINDSIIYTPDDGTLKVTGSSQDMLSGEISLAPTANRLLAMLISHHGSILHRDELLDNVWDAHGLRASNNSLNQYISILRRYFADIGIEEAVIVTIPTVGFMFNKDITVVRDMEPSSVAKRNTENEKIAPPRILQKKVSLFNAKLINSFVLIILLAITTFNFYYSMQPKRIDSQYEKRYLLGKVESCPVYTFYHTSSSSKDKYMSLVNKSMEKASFHCKGNAEIFFKIEDLALYNKKATMFIAICSRQNENSFSNCRSYYTN